MVTVDRPRRIELFIEQDQVLGLTGDIWRAFENSRGPHEPSYGTRTFGVRLDALSFEEAALTATLDAHGFRLVFEDELPATLPVPREMVLKYVITDRVPSSVRQLKECAGCHWPIKDDEPPYRYAWRVTGLEPNPEQPGEVIWEIVVKATDLDWAIRVFELVRGGAFADSEWQMSPWHRVGL